jgi:hypothetical protein
MHRKTNGFPVKAKSMVRLTALFLSAVLCFSTAVTDSPLQAAGPDMHGRGTRLTVDSDGLTVINRKEIPDGKRMGKAGTWMIYLYLCGSNLETDDSEGTEIINEAIYSSEDTCVSFLIMTGGSEKWHFKGIDSGKNYLIYVKDGKTKIVGSWPKESMGDSDTLSKFLQYAVKKYPGEKMGLSLWDHGGGSVSGVCFDQQYDDDSLSLVDIDRALQFVSGSMTHKFDFIGCDACLMGTLETACILAPYADYMIGSEENQYGSWNYNDLGYYLYKHPDAGGEEVADSIIEDYQSVLDSMADDEKKGNSDGSPDDEGKDAVYKASMAAQSVVDLSMADLLTDTVDVVSEAIDQELGDPDFAQYVSDSLRAADNFGGNNPSSGYTNMIDLFSFFNELCEESNAKKNYPDLYKAVNDPEIGFNTILQMAVTDKAMGTAHEGCGGLAVYYPLQLQGSEEMQMFKEIAVSAPYYDFVNRELYGKWKGNLDGYDNHSQMQAFWSGKTYSHPSWDPGNLKGNSRIKLEKTVLNGNRVVLQIDPSTMDQVASVQSFLIADLGDNVGQLFGFSDAVRVDSSKNTAAMTFDPYWMSAAESVSFLSCFIQDSGEDFTTWSAPVSLNGEETNLLFTLDKDSGDYSIDGTWKGIGEDGASDRDLTPVEKGDRLAFNPVFVDLSAGDLDPYMQSRGEAGTEFEAGEDLGIDLYGLSSGDYLIGFRVTDIYGGYLYSDRVRITLDDDGKIVR